MYTSFFTILPHWTSESAPILALYPDPTAASRAPPPPAWRDGGAVRARARNGRVGERAGHSSAVAARGAGPARAPRAGPRPATHARAAPAPDGLPVGRAPCRPVRCATTSPAPGPPSAPFPGPSATCCPPYSGDPTAPGPALPPPRKCVRGGGGRNCLPRACPAPHPPQAVWCQGRNPRPPSAPPTQVPLCSSPWGQAARSSEVQLCSSPGGWPGPPSAPADATRASPSAAAPRRASGVTSRGRGGSGAGDAAGGPPHAADGPPHAAGAPPHAAGGPAGVAGGLAPPPPSLSGAGDDERREAPGAGEACPAAADGARPGAQHPCQRPAGAVRDAREGQVFRDIQHGQQTTQRRRSRAPRRGVHFRSRPSVRPAPARRRLFSPRRRPRCLRGGARCRCDSQCESVTD